MLNKRVIVFSRTPWYEPPRIRHQFTKMLLNIGYQVTYVETLFRQRKSKKGDANGELKVVSVREVIHHQLQFLSLISILNQFFIKLQLRFLSIEKNDISLVVNFNYDFHFLTELFPRSKVITLLNDDFVAMAKPWMKSQAMYLLRKTCNNSNLVLSVSYSIHNQALLFSQNARIFLPWSDINYQKPAVNKSRNVILYFGFISRLDIDLVNTICRRGIRIRFVGPIEGNGSIVKDIASKLENVEFLGTVNSIDEISIDDICCSMAFYDINDESNLAITASNRMFRLLSYGIPLVYPNMPNLIEAPDTVIRKCKNENEFFSAFDFFSKNFDTVQPEIESFLLKHTYQQRVWELKDLIQRVNVAEKINQN